MFEKKNSGRQSVLILRRLLLASFVFLAIGFFSLSGLAGQEVQVPPPSEKAESFYYSGNVLWVINVILGFFLPALFLFTGFSARIRNQAARLGKNWYFTIVLYFLLFSIILYIIEFPLNYYQGFIRMHEYGLSNQSFGRWFGNSLKGLGLGLLGGALFLWVPYLLLKKAPQRWWLYTGILSIPFTIFMVYIQPLYIAPLFNEFGPMKNKELEAKILDLAQKSGIEGSRVFEVNKSVDTKALNAYVTGFGESHRIVLWDTIIEKLTDDQLLFVMGHEMGHYVLGHIWQGILFTSIITILSLYIAHRAAKYFLKKYSQRFGFQELSDIASLPLLMLLMSLFSFAVTPMFTAYSRYKEHQADIFGLEITKNNRAAAEAFVQLQQENLAYPYPGFLYKLWRSSHPPIGERVDFINHYRPWEKGEAGQYEHLFAKDD